MMTFYVYKTNNGTLKMADYYVASHVLKISAKTEAAAKRALTNYKKMLKENGEQ